jgi:hypothetical protein
VSVTVSTFGDDGWEARSHGWGRQWSQGTPLVEVIAETASLPSDEAEEIAAETLREWEVRRDHRAEWRQDWENIVFLGSTFALAALGLIGLTALLVSRFVKRLRPPRRKLQFLRHR